MHQIAQWTVLLAVASNSPAPAASAQCPVEILRPDSFREIVQTSRYSRNTAIVVAHEGRQELLRSAIEADPSLGATRAVKSIGAFSVEASGMQLDGAVCVGCCGCGLGDT
jgi:hypothetical protein